MPRRQNRTCAADVAVIVGAMTIKPVLDLTPKAPRRPSSKRLLAQGGRSTVELLQRVFLPHLAAGLGMLLICVGAAYSVWIAPLHFPRVITAGLVALLLVIYGAFSLGYALFASCAFTLYEACDAWEDFIAQMLARVQQRAEEKLAGLDEGLAKNQAKVLIRGSVREVLHSAGKAELSTWPRWLSAVCLGGLTLAMRAVLIARVVKWTGTTIKVSKIFAGKATLVGAIFLNLRFFALLLVCVVYGLGGAVVVLHGLLWLWSK